MRKTSNQISSTELPTVPIDLPTSQEGSHIEHLTVASQMTVESGMSYVDPPATIPEDGGIASTKSWGPKTKRGKGMKTKPGRQKASKVSVDQIVTQDLALSLAAAVLKPGTGGMTLSQTPQNTSDMGNINNTPPSDQNGGPRTQTEVNIDKSNEEEPSLEIFDDRIGDSTSISKSGNLDDVPISDSNGEDLMKGMYHDSLTI